MRIGYNWVKSSAFDWFLERSQGDFDVKLSSLIHNINSSPSHSSKRKEPMYRLLQKKSCVKAIYLIPSRRPAEDFSKCSLDSGRWTVEASHFLEVLIIWKETTYYSREESLAPPEDLNSEHCWTRAKRREATTHWMMVVAGVCNNVACKWWFWGAARQS